MKTKTCIKKAFSDRASAIHQANFQNYPEIKKGRKPLYEIYPCDPCDAWHVVRIRAKRV